MAHLQSISAIPAKLTMQYYAIVGNLRRDERQEIAFTLTAKAKKIVATIALNAQ